MAKNDALKVTPSTGNVFRDLGFSKEESEHLLVRADLLIQLQKAIAAKELKQAEAATVLRVTQPRVSDLQRGRIDLFSTDTLINMLARLGITCTPRREDAPFAQGGMSPPLRLPVARQFPIAYELPLEPPHGRKNQKIVRARGAATTSGCRRRRGRRYQRLRPGRDSGAHRPLTCAIIASVPRTRPRLAAPARTCSRAPCLT